MSTGCYRFVLALGAALLAVPLQAASPSLTTILPRGMQRGSEQALVFSGARLSDAQEVLFYSPGFEVTKLEAASAEQVKVTVKVAGDCRLGEHVVQLRTASGISEYRTFYVGALPEVAEQEPNTTFEAPQAIALNVTVQGIIENEDVDYFAVEAKAGQRIAVEVEGMRLGTTLFDPYVAILDSKRFELAAADDTPLVQQDAAVVIVAPEDGRYFIQVRESAYGGNGNCHYRLHIGTFPRPTAAYPAGGKLGEQLDVRFLGDAAGELTQRVEVPGVPTSNYELFASDAGGVAASGIPFRLFEHGNLLESEPNNTVAEATPAELPLALNGIIGQPGDSDFFKFSAKHGQVFEIECYGRRLRSPIDPVMNLYNASGQSLIANDDARGPDSYFRFTIPADGEYLLSVHDHLLRGGADFIYRVEFTPVQPSLVLGIPRVEQYSQYRQTVFVPRGNRFGTVISATRNNFGGEIILDGTELPQGVTMVADPMAASVNVMPVVFEAAADAPVEGQLANFTGRHSDQATNIGGGFANRADFVIGPPNQSLYRWCDVDRLAIAVVDELPWTLEIVEPKVPLVRSGSMQLKILAHRKEGFNAPINVQVPFLPPGVGGASTVSIPEGQTEVLYPLNANGGAELRQWKIFALSSADVGGAAWVSSQLARLEVAEAPLAVTMERASCEQGQPAQVYCKLVHTKPIEGTAKVQLVGLPHKVTAPEVEITKDTQEFVFAVTTDKESPVGKHKNLFCQIVIPQNGEAIVHSAGSTELQIDAPLPAPATPAAPAPAPEAAAAAPAPAPVAPPAEKPLTRLQKLRLAAGQPQ